MTLLFLEDLEFLAQAVPQNRLDVVLVDHNHLSPELAHLQHARVVSIFDHHVDEGKYPSAHPRVIETVGSTASLVACEWQRRYTVGKIECAILAQLLVGAILIDTVNLNPEFGRTFDKDLEAMKYLETCFSHTEPFSEWRYNYFEELKKAKTDLRHLNGRDLLRKDYKRWTLGGCKTGISSVTWFLVNSGDQQGWIGRDGIDVFQRETQRFIQEHSLRVLIVMSAFDHGGDVGFKRELLVTFQLECDVVFVDKFVAKLKEAEELGLEGILLPAVQSTPPMFLFLQHNKKASRKQVQPIVKRVLESLSS
jgi:exopolyphosphatase